MKRVKKWLALLLTVCLLLPAAAPAAADEQPYVHSDTTMPFDLAPRQTYTFQLTEYGTQAVPNITAGNGNVLQTEDVSCTPSGTGCIYTFKVRAIGQVGQETGIYTTLPGQSSVRHCVVRVGGAYVQSDTTMDFSLKEGSSYAFRFEVKGTRDLTPNIVTGNGSILSTQNVRKCVENDNDVYYFTVCATGTAGQSTGVYTTLPGQSSVRHCSISITPGGTYNPSAARQVFALVNQERAKAGVPALKWADSLANCANIRASELNRRFSHTRPDGSLCFTAYPSSETRRTYGENVARVSSPSPATVMGMWMNSEGHRANILNPSFTALAVGCFERNGMVYWAQDFEG